MSYEDDEVNKFIDFLVEMGVLKPMGFNVDIGEDLFIITEEAADIIPEIPKIREKETNQAIFELWQRNMLDVVFDEEGMPMVSLNKNSTDKEKIEEIDDPILKNQMYMIVSIFSDYFDNK
jgi:hypothetical protein